MSSLLFYIIIVVLLIAASSLFIKQRRKKNSNHRIRREAPFIQGEILVAKEDGDDAEPISYVKESLDLKSHSPYAKNLIVLKIKAFPDKPYMGYELHQALLGADLSFDNEGIFHRYTEKSSNNVLFSLAVATATGRLPLENLGRFKCAGLLIFMQLDSNKKKLMASFDLMLDTARQLCEELGGEIYDDSEQLINATVIKRQRQRICIIETGNMYNADLLDNLD